MYDPPQPRTLSMSGAALPTCYDMQVLTPLRLRGTEALGKLYEYALDVATVDCPPLRKMKAMEVMVPDNLIGKSIDIGISFEGNGTFTPGLQGQAGQANHGAGTRTISGLITAVQITGSDELHAYYRFIVRPWLHLATLNCENRIFQNASVIDVTQQILKERYPFPVEYRLGAIGMEKTGYPKRDFIRQFWQSDHAFLTMLWREWGIYYFFDGLTLVLCDSPGSHRKHRNAYDRIRYHAPDGARIDEEHIHRLKLSKKLTGGKVELVDYDYTRSLARLDGSNELYSKRALDNARHYRWGDYAQPLAGAMGLSGEPNDYRTEANYLASVRVDAMRCRNLRVRGRGNLRGLTTGKTFWLDDHPVPKVNAEYLVVSTTLDIRNPSESTQSDSGHDHTYQCVTDFVLQPANAFFRNRPKKRRPRCSAETAVVVGPKNQPMWVDGYARIKIQFVWDRLGSNDENSSCWVRVSSPWQGHGYGFVALPRIGEEVTVSYHEGDVDRPYVSDRMVNQFNPPPWNLPQNQALSGLLSRSLAEGQSNHVVTDDTPDHLQVQVASDHAQSRLVLGYNTRIVRLDGRQDARGEGWELATEAWGVARANRGMLITTEARAGAMAPVKDMGETVQRLTQARDLQESLTGLAQQHTAQQANADQSEVTKAIKAQNDAIRGGTKSHGNPFPEFSEPHLILASPAGIQASTSGSTHLASNENLALTTGSNVGIAAGKSFFASIAHAFSLFVHQLGIKLVAAAGKVQIEAQQDMIELTAKRAVEIISSTDWINLKAKQGIRLNGGGTELEISAQGILGFTNGQFLMHAASHAMPGPQTKPQTFPGHSICPALAGGAASSGAGTVPMNPS